MEGLYGPRCDCVTSLDGEFEDDDGNCMLIGLGFAVAPGLNPEPGGGEGELGRELPSFRRLCTLGGGMAEFSTMKPCEGLLSDTRRLEGPGLVVVAAGAAESTL